MTSLSGAVRKFATSLSGSLRTAGGERTFPKTANSSATSRATVSRMSTDGWVGTNLHPLSRADFLTLLKADSFTRARIEQLRFAKRRSFRGFRKDTNSMQETEKWR